MTTFYQNATLFTLYTRAPNPHLLTQTPIHPPNNPSSPPAGCDNPSNPCTIEQEQIVCIHCHHVNSERKQIPVRQYKRLSVKDRRGGEGIAEDVGMGREGRRWGGGLR